MERSGGGSRLVCALGLALAVASVRSVAAITRHDFPEGFVFGAGTSAYQVRSADLHRMVALRFLTVDVLKHPYAAIRTVEGAWNEDGKKPSIWDTYAHDDGRGAVNPKGLEYYNNLIDELLSYGKDDFTAYADVCFRNFGDRVKRWTTLNEPNIEPLDGFDLGFLPPRRCSSPFGDACAGGNSTTEPYIVGHHLLLAHASAVSLYRDKYQAVQGGQIGLALLAYWFEPSTRKPKDIAAAGRMNDFSVGWFMHPLVYGDYPPVMRRNAGSRLPILTNKESVRVRGSFDFVGINHYGVLYVEADMSQLNQTLRDYSADTAAKLVTLPFQISRNQLRFGIQNSEAPWALQKMLDYLKLKYHNPSVVIYENGAGHETDPSGMVVTNDEFRSHYLQVYIEAMLLSISNGSDVHGYFVWSFMDVFEVLFAYRFRFGLYGVDFSSKERTRYARHSARWYTGFLHGGKLGPAMSPSSIRAYSES
ncbi:hypothetical protein PR202_ga20682 [Eleusine coracana subsp. coracana]|uniref:Beta-glucosidase 11 n=1 Tax=Eleusine coracana subsp. coracana TaxID=191504 RepID=A0AAV5CXS2_ELECO|nr:hypothetical protein PR202_ga20682 [Eleusine coracana subsp. coracana]